MSADHTITIDLESFSPYSEPNLACHAPADALCHAVYDCGCETWSADGVEDGKPWHQPGVGADADERHYGTFDPTNCNFKNWADNTEGCLRGTITIPVTAEWEGDYYLFHAVPATDDAPKLIEVQA